jgi:protein SCO1/2
MQATIRLEQVKAASTGCLHLLAGAAIAGVLLCFACAAFAVEPMNMDEHAHHHAMDMNRVKRSVADYPLPTLQLVRNDGVPVSFPKEIDDGRPVILDFIYTSCTTVCPLTSQVLSEVQNKLSKSSAPVHLVSISIDPEYDTPERLTAYARTYHAGAQWQHYTGTTQASIALQQAFNAYRGDKMNHLPLTFLRASPGKPWVRLDGLANPDEVVAEYQQLVASK